MESMYWIWCLAAIPVTLSVGIIIYQCGVRMGKPFWCWWIFGENGILDVFTIEVGIAAARISAKVSGVRRVATVLVLKAGCAPETGVPVSA